jgi:hypothetical protein
LRDFRNGLRNILADQWDRKIDADILAGRLDAAGRRADEDFDAGRCTRMT